MQKQNVVNSTAAPVPAIITKPTTTPVKANPKNKQKMTRLIEILETDHNYNIVQEIVDHMKLIKRSKKLKPLEKHRMLQNYHITLLSYCMPKMKITEDTRDSGGKGVTFNINIAGTDGTATPVGVQKGRKGVSVSIPTRKQKDGTFVVDQPGD